MSYHVTILRSQRGKQLPILLQEARAAASSLGGWVFTDSPDAFTYGTGDKSTVLWYEGGQLWTKNPETSDLENMLRFATALGARVRGDDFETYRSADESYTHPDDRGLKEQAERKLPPAIEAELRRQIWIRRGIIAFFVILAVIGYNIGKLFEK